MKGKVDPAIQPASLDDTFFVTRGGDLECEWLEGVKEHGGTDIQLFPTCYVYHNESKAEAYMAVDEFDQSMLGDINVQGLKFLKFNYAEIIMVTKLEF